MQGEGIALIRTEQVVVNARLMIVYFIQKSEDLLFFLLLLSLLFTDSI